MAVYIIGNPKTKAALKRMVAKSIESDGRPVQFYQPGPFGNTLVIGNKFTGTIAAQGPHYPAAHTWWAELTVEDGMIVKVK